MVFSSLFFVLFFLPLNLVCYFATDDIRKKNIIILVFSLIFYAWGEPVYVLLLLAMSFFCWLFSLQIDRNTNKGTKKLWLALAAVVCIGSIGFFKYAGFLVQNINSLFGSELAVPSVALPIGISFYTFQLLTYVVDVYRGEVPAQRHYWKVLLYASLFHQCIAGPIVRYGDVQYEIDHRKSSISDISRGITRFSFGLAKKAVFANGCGAVVDALLLSDADIGTAAMLDSNLSLLAGRSALALWAGMAFYMLQIYLDFSAYSDMAIGMGLMCGFHYKENFDYPYMSASVTEFWRRWHISLGSFFRDYVYIPLGGNRKGKGRQIFNIFVVWALTGLWHGASWNFVLWGLYFFALLMLEKLFLLPKLQKKPVLGRLYTLAVVYFGWIFFKFTNGSMIGTVFKGMFLLNHNSFSSYEANHFIGGYILFFILSCLACTKIVPMIGNLFKNLSKENRLADIVCRVGDVIIPILLIGISVLSLVGDSFNPFLYFQF